MIEEIDLEEGVLDPPRTEYSLDHRLQLKGRTFVESLLGELNEGRGRAPSSPTAEKTRRIVSCVLANLVKAKDRRVIVKMDKNANYEGLSQKIAH